MVRKPTPHAPVSVSTGASVLVVADLALVTGGAISNVMKARHDTAKNTISNIR